VSIEKHSSVHIHVSGVVQGVGFRPFVYGLAAEHHLAGWVRNTSAGVDLHLEGTPANLEHFQRQLKDAPPPLSRINEIVMRAADLCGYETFEIIHSETVPGAFQPISPDTSICPDCLNELFHPTDRRFRYPFINCTNCGPRFTIIDDIPYDRPKTTMAPFQLCEPCAAEYADPLDRRFHAQPVACPDCGPQIWLEIDGERLADAEGALQQARKLLIDGGILAVKGLGGFHLACDARNSKAVAELRQRKLRIGKPFALMMADIEAVETVCFLNESEKELLESRERPIVLLGAKPDNCLSPDLAPGQSTLGVMLPYTPLHHLLIEAGPQFPSALVMTSGNLSEEPIATKNDDARDQLADLADAFLMHNRGIRTRCDDSVVRVVNGHIYPLRRSRGYAPFPVRLPGKAMPVLAVGGELKNTYCITRDDYAFLSQHIGDLQNYETLSSFEESIAHYEQLFRVRPEALAYDLHPDYLATRYALQRAKDENIPILGVQHHHAHAAACMVEHGLKPGSKAIAAIFDGTGYGDDGSIWGGEFLLAGYEDYLRRYHLKTIEMPGGDAAVRNPWRLALSWLHQAGLDFDEFYPSVSAADPEARKILLQQLEKKINSPKTSSMGRLFDAAASLTGIRHSVNYEAQAAIEMETLVDPDEKASYAFDILANEIDPIPVIGAICKDIRAGVSKGKMAARFHNAVAEMTIEVCSRIANETQIETIVLSGGVWQNMVLLKKTYTGLQALGLEVLQHSLVPANDGGLALGQAIVAQSQMQSL
jgi:hydrogenase maturation protein HypF